MKNKNLKCHICGKATEHWIKLFLWVFVNGERVNRKVHLCEGCGNTLEGLLQNAEAMIVTLFLASQGVDPKQLPKLKLPSQEESS